jgi:hypothetical protein
MNDPGSGLTGKGLSAPPEVWKSDEIPFRPDVAGRPNEVTR